MPGGWRGAVKAWLGGHDGPAQDRDHAAGHRHDNDVHEHGHAHGVVDPTVATTTRGIFAIKWSFVILAVTAGLQMVVVAVSGSVALLADTIHNVGDATTAIPLWIAFLLARRKPTARFPFGLGRVEDLAGLAIVLVILVSALVAGYEAIDRFFHPREVGALGWVAAAGIIGFVGNEAVALFRIRIGREINSAALVADGFHARTDGLTSLAVVLGAAGVWLGMPLADPIVGLLITVAIFGIVWQSAKVVVSRMLDGVDPEIIDQIRHGAERFPELRVQAIRARWVGHRLHTEIEVAVDPGDSVSEAGALAEAFKASLREDLPALERALVVVAADSGLPSG